MGWLILIAMFILGIVVFCKKDVSTTTQSAGANTPQKFRRFDENNPSEICEIAYGLSLLAAIAGDSHVHTVLQDEYPAKGWAKCMRISASIDDCISSRKEWIPSDVRQYLESVPFKVSRTSSDYTVEYTFKDIYPTPSDFKYGVIDEMKKGASKSTFVKNGMHQFRVRDNGYIALDVDD